MTQESMDELEQMKGELEENIRKYVNAAAVKRVRACVRACLCRSLIAGV